MTKIRTILNVSILTAIVTALAVVGLASAGNAFTRQGVFQNGEGHCANGPAGLTSQTRIIVRPKTLNPVVSGPWAVQRVEQYLNKDQTMIHLIGPASLTSGVEIVNGVSVDIVIENRALCGDVPPPPPTCEELGNCPPVPCEETNTCPPTPTCETDESLCPPPVEPTCETDPSLCPTVVPPVVPPVELIPPVVQIATPVPVPPTAEVTTPPALALTGARTTGLAVVGIAAIGVGLLMLRGQKTVVGPSRERIGHD